MDNVGHEYVVNVNGICGDRLRRWYGIGQRIELLVPRSGRYQFGSRCVEFASGGNALRLIGGANQLGCVEPWVWPDHADVDSPYGAGRRLDPRI